MMIDGNDDRWRRGKGEDQFYRFSCQAMVQNLDLTMRRGWVTNVWTNHTIYSRMRKEALFRQYLTSISFGWWWEEREKNVRKDRELFHPHKAHRQHLSSQCILSYDEWAVTYLEEGYSSLHPSQTLRHYPLSGQLVHTLHSKHQGKRDLSRPHRDILRRCKGSKERSLSSDTQETTQKKEFIHSEEEKVRETRWTNCLWSSEDTTSPHNHTRRIVFSFCAMSGSSMSRTA